MTVRRVPESRVRRANQGPLRPDGEYVLYWMTAARRPTWNHALDHAVALAAELSRPLLVLEALRADYPFASERITRFVLDGMRDNAAFFAGGPARYFPYLERRAGDGKGLLEALAARACVVVADDSPAFFLPRMVAAAARRLDVRMDAVDGNGLLPLAAADGVFPTAHGFRRVLHRTLGPHLRRPPKERPFAGVELPPPPDLPADVARRWPAEVADLLGAPFGRTVGGREAGRARLARFVADGLPRYAEEAREPSAGATSGLSPYLHFGHVGAHEVLAAATAPHDFDPGRVSPKAAGRRLGYWGLPEAVESFLDELVTWREVGFHTAAKLPRYDEYDTLPGWAQKTLAEHEDDPRESLYSPEEFEAAATRDDIWNAAQRQLVRDGTIHGYLRMLWGKKILEWSPSPREALRIMLELNDRYALDGRDPNSVSGTFWCLGRYDRAWGPERPIFGKIRYMTSDSTRRKLHLDEYLEEYGEDPCTG